MRLIDADAFSAVMKKRQDVVKEWMSKGKDRETCARAESAYVMLCEVKLTLDKMPTVDAVEVKHGEWIIDGMNEYELSYGCVGYEPIYRCSKCGITTESYLRTERPIMPEDADFPNYCPNCGAKMDGERRDND